MIINCILPKMSTPDQDYNMMDNFSQKKLTKKESFYGPFGRIRLPHLLVGRVVVSPTPVAAPEARPAPEAASAAAREAAAASTPRGAVGGRHTRLVRSLRHHLKTFKTCVNCIMIHRTLIHSRAFLKYKSFKRRGEISQIKVFDTNLYKKKSYYINFKLEI